MIDDGGAVEKYNVHPTMPVSEFRSPCNAKVFGNIARQQGFWGYSDSILCLGAPHFLASGRKSCACAIGKCHQRQHHGHLDQNPDNGCERGT